MMKILNQRTTGVRLTGILLFVFALCSSAFAASQSYTYDTLNRLTSVVYDNGQQITYSYDAAGNRLAMSGNTLTAPNAFAFTPQTNVSLNTPIASNPITVSGVNAAPIISITGGEYSINGGAYTATPGNVVNADNVTVRLTSANAYSTPASATLTIGGVSGTFNVTTIPTTLAATLSPTALTFTSQNVGTAGAVQSVTLTNTGNAALNIASIVASGDFARTTACLATLAAGANCAINVTFTPTAAGMRVGAVTITSDAAGSPHTVSLSGMGVATDITPPAVTALAAGGAYTSAQAVVLSANEPATIYYTLDGSVPTTASAVYSAPIVVGSSLTLKYFAVDAAGNASAVQSQIYSITIDTIAPAGTVSINGGAATTHTTAVSLALSATDNSGTVASMRFSNDGLTWSAWEAYAASKPWTLLAGNAVKTVHAQFEDASGNISLPASASITLSVMPLTTTPALLWRNGGLLVGSTPLLGDDGRFYAIGTSAADGSGSGAIAFNATDGTRAWGPVFPSGAGCTLGEMSMGANGLLYAVGDWNSCGDGRLVALNASNGSTAWDHGDCPGGGNTSPHPRQVPALDEALNSVYFGSSMLCSVDMNSGVNNWAASGGFYIGEKGLSVDSAQNIYYGSSNGGAGADGKISSYTSAGAFRWERALPGRAESGIVGMTLGDALLLRSQYPAGASTRLLAWDTNGNDLWFADNLDRAITDAAGNIYASSVTGADIVALDFNGIERWRQTLPGAASARLDFVDNAGRLYARGNNVLYVLNSADGTIAWTFTADASLGVGAVLDQFGHILLADSASNLYLLDTALEYSVSPWPVAQYGNQRHTGKLGTNVPGTLSYAAVNVAPSSGTASTSFTYNVVYDNASNVAPRSVRVCIDALPCGAMNVDAAAAAALQDGNYVNGEQYAYTTSLVAGAHTYYFTASDGATSIKLPATGSLSGPAVSSLSIATSALPNGTAGTAYSQMLAATGGTAPYTYSASGLPAGLALNSGTGQIYGTPIASGMYGFSVSVTDATGATLSGVLSINVVAGSQIVSFGTAPTIVVGGIGTVSATGGASGNAVTFSSMTPAVCTVSGSTVTAVAAGACTIAADQAGNANYNPATQVTQTITISKASQTVSFGTAPTIVVGGTGTVSATGGASGNAVTFSSMTPAVCTSSGNTVTAVAAGACTIVAEQAGDANYNPATQVTQTITISKASQTISYGSAPALVVNGTSTVSATASSGLAVSFSSATPAVCTVSGNTVTAVAAGICTITASQAGDSNYLAAPQVMQSFTVGQAAQAISFGALANHTFGDAPFAVSATASSGLAVSFIAGASAACTLTGNTATIIAAGACTITASQTGDSNYIAAPQVMQSFTVGQAAQPISFGAPPVVMVGGTGTVSATGGASGNAVIFTSQTPLVCTASGTNGSTVTGVAVGACTIAASQPGNANYLDAPQFTQTFAISATVGALSPSAVAFPDQLVGTTSTAQTVTLSNAGTAALTVGTIAITGNFNRPSKTCGNTLAAGSSCTISVAFAPRAAGLLTGTLTVGNNGTVALSGTGLAPSASITPAAYTFANQQVSTTSAIQTFTYSNTGPVPITVSAVALGGAAAANYAIASNACTGVTLSPGTSCDLGVTFTPSAANNRVATLSVTDTAGGAPAVTASLNGTGVAATATLIGSAAFGNQQVGVASATQTFTYQNMGTGPFTVSSAAISGTAAANYAIASDTCTGATLGASATCSIGLVFTPSATGNRTARLTVTSAAGGPPAQRLSLIGTGVAPIISLGGRTYRYGAVTIPTAAIFTLTNTGTAPFVISAITLTTGTQFNVAGGTCTVGGSVSNGNSCTLNVLFTPVGTTTFTDTLTATGAGVGMGAPAYSATRAMSGR